MKAAAPEVEGLDALAAWAPAPVFLTQRLGASVSQQGFTLRRVERTATQVVLSAKWGHDVGLSRPVSVDGGARAVRVVERFAAGVERVTHLWRLVLPGGVPIDEAGHVIFRDSSINALGARDVLCLPDLLAARRAPGWDVRLRTAVAAWRGRAVVLWVGAHVNELLGLWRACTVVRAENVWLALVPDPLSVNVLEAAAMGFAFAEPLRAVDHRRFASQWRTLASGRRPPRPWLPALGALFARRTGALAPIDELLVRQFTRWRSPFDVVRRDAEVWAPAFELFGDDIPARVARLAEAGRLRRRASGLARPSAWTRFEYQR